MKIPSLAAIAAAFITLSSAHAGLILPLKAGESMHDVARSAFSVTQVSPRLVTNNGTKYRVTVVDYGPGSMAPSNLIVYVSGKDGDLGGDAGYENAFYLEAAVVSVASFSTLQNEVVLKVRVINENGKIVIKVMTLKYIPESNKLWISAIH
jgi:hypothetical protein